MSNIFVKAKALQKQAQYKNTPWQQLVKIAAGKQVFSTKKVTAMATPKKRKAAPRKTHHKRVSGVGRTTTTVRKVSTKRKQVGALVDRHMFNLALGMAASSVVEQMILVPLKQRVPDSMKIFVDPAQAVLAYKGSTHYKDPIIQGICLSLMKGGVDGTVKIILTKFPQLKMNAVAGDNYYALPAPNMGEIKQYLGAIPENIGNINDSSMPNFGDLQESELILPLGWNK